MKHSSQPWWTNSEYEGDSLAWWPPEFKTLSGPKGMAYTPLYSNGLPRRGWGLNPPKDHPDEPGFMHRYLQGEFSGINVRQPFAMIMRATQLVCIDIDGKNGGIEEAKKLVLPPTLAQISKSENGYHLFYIVPQIWDDETGFSLLGDRIGMVQGVDFRGVGCVFHYPNQRWNARPAVDLPKHIFEMVQSRQQMVRANQARIASVLEDNDPLEVLMLQDELVGELAKPIPSGKRNNTLFAIGSQMMQANVDDWQTKVYDRAIEVGLTHDETDKLVNNISKYGANV